MKVSCASCHTLYPLVDGVDGVDARDLAAPISGVRSATCARCREPSLRSLAPTLPRGAAPDLRPSPSPEAEATEPPPASRVRSRRRDWCVDFGSSLAPMSTFELWVSIASGEVRGEALVWRDGMECWTPVRALPELACAMRIEEPVPVETGWEREAANAPPTDRAEPDGLLQVITAPSEVAGSFPVTPHAPGATGAPDTPDDVATPHTPEADGTVLLVRRRRQARPQAAPRSRPPRDARAVAAGAAVALLVIGVASFASGGDRPGRPGARKTEPSWATAAQVVSSSIVLAPGARPGDAQASLPRGEPVARRADPGQVRMRRGQRLQRRAE